jgi:acyl-CoA synthetase (AMP-forming)/AMP-acid ligase II/acyl carrier protein
MNVSNYNNLVDLLRQRAVDEPDFPAFTFLKDGEIEEDVLTHQIFDAKAKKIAAQLQQLHLTGERVLLLFPQSTDYLVALFACFYAKVIAVPAYPPRNNRNMLRLEAIIQNCDAKAILADQNNVAQIQKSKKDFSGFQLLSFEDLLSTSENDYQPTTILPDDIAYLQYTSGSTGSPKGVIIRHGNMMHNINGLEETFGGKDIYRQTFVTWIPMYHDMGLMSMMTALKKNISVYFMAPVHFVQQPARWLRAVSKYKAFYTLAPNFAFDYCCDKILDEQLEGVDLSSLWAVTNGSETVRMGTLVRFYERFKKWGFNFDIFCPAYGLAEATLVVSTTHGLEPVHARKKEESGESVFSKNGIFPQDFSSYEVSAGLPVSRAEVLIVDAETLSPLKESVEGEIWVHSPGSVASGYWGNEEASQHTYNNWLDGKQYLRTGDLGYLLNGRLYVTGRIKDMVIIRGRNYYPQDIEQIVQQCHEALEPHSGAAFSVERNDKEELTVIQEVSRKHWRKLDKDEVIAQIRKEVAQAFDVVVGGIVLITPMSLPKTSSGKIQRYLAKEQYLNNTLRIVAEWTATEEEEIQPEPETAALQEISKDAIMKWLVTNLAAKTKLPPAEIDIHTSVRDYPLESIDAIYLADELSKWLGIKVTAESFWALPTIDALAAFLDDKYQKQKSE